jgi:hypothetical protein
LYYLSKEAASLVSARSYELKRARDIGAQQKHILQQLMSLSQRQ